jgi:hypothetical protein
MGQAAAMTGGYGNSYAATAGNQAYQAHLEGLNDIVPELYQMAYDRYNQEGQDMLNQYSMAKGVYDTKYGEYADAMNQYNADNAFLYGAYSDSWNRDYGKWSDGYQQAWDQHVQDILNAQYAREEEWKQAEFDEAIRQHDEAMA